ncbi:transglycosylase domain-containing protein, partial [Heyndrickxia sporothermodurans]
MTEKYQTREERRKQQETAKNKKQKKGKKKSIFKRIILTIVMIGIIGFLAGAGTFAYYASKAPKLDKKMLKDPIASVIYGMNNKPIETVGSVNRDYIAYDKIPDRMKDAILATEDIRFFKHHGIDPIRLGGAVLANFKRGFGSEGASTITQQVVKMSFLTEKKTLERKAQEAWLSLQLERQYTKEEIFEMYVNKIYMSDGVHGISTAAKYYYNKSLD